MLSAAGQGRILPASFVVEDQEESLLLHSNIAMYLSVSFGQALICGAGRCRGSLLARAVKSLSLFESSVPNKF